MPEFSEEALKKIAKEKVGKRLAVQIHAAAYVGVNIMLLVINLLTSPSYWWFLWPLCSWAVGLTMHVASYLIWLAGVTSGAKIGLLYNLVAYVTVNIYLVFVWWMAGAGYMWFLYPLFGWLVGVIAHGMAIKPKTEQKSWMDKKVDAELARIKEKETKNTPVKEA